MFFVANVNTHQKGKYMKYCRKLSHSITIKDVVEVFKSSINLNSDFPVKHEKKLRNQPNNKQ